MDVLSPPGTGWLTRTSMFDRTCLYQGIVGDDAEVQSGFEAPIKTVAQLQPNCVFPECPIDLKDIGADVQALFGTPYAQPGRDFAGYQVPIVWGQILTAWASRHMDAHGTCECQKTPFGVFRQRSLALTLNLNSYPQSRGAKATTARFTDHMITDNP